MPVEDRVLKSYGIFLKFLMFTLKNNDNLKYKNYALVRNYLAILEEIEKYYKQNFCSLIGNDKEENFQFISKYLFNDEFSEYIKHIDNYEKKKLIKFQYLIRLTDFASEEGDSDTVYELDRMLRKITSQICSIYKEFNVD